MRVTAALVAILDPVGPGDIADRLGVTSAAVANWRARGLLPAPLFVVSCGAVWPWLVVRRWAIETGRLTESPSPWAPALALIQRGLHRITDQLVDSRRGI